MTLVNIVGHAIFHTAGVSGPSMIERSYFRVLGGAGGIGETDGAVGATGTVMPSIYESSDQHAADEKYLTPVTGSFAV